MDLNLNQFEGLNIGDTTYAFFHRKPGSLNEIKEMEYGRGILETVKIEDIKTVTEDQMDTFLNKIQAELPDHTGEWKLGGGVFDKALQTRIHDLATVLRSASRSVLINTEGHKYARYVAVESAMEVMGKVKAAYYGITDNAGALEMIAEEYQDEELDAIVHQYFKADMALREHLNKKYKGWD